MKAVQSIPQKLKTGKIIWDHSRTGCTKSVVTCTVQMVIELTDQNSMMSRPKCEII